MMPLSESLLEQVGHPFKLTVANDIKEAARGAAAVITTIREGFEKGRAIDERICLDYNVIGQETTGPAGFAFACRSVPVLVNYARDIFDISPDAWLINFTNPAGIVTEAMNEAGFDRVVGICDSADTARTYASDYLGVERMSVTTQVAGLNHLSFTTSIQHDGQEKLGQLLADATFLKKAMPVFPASLIGDLNAYLNEYLYYFFMPEQALKAMVEEEKCRGELIVEWNEDLLSRLEGLLTQDQIQQGLDAYFAYQRQRNESYMDYARSEDRYLPTNEEEGYAGVALDFLQAVNSQTPVRHTLCAVNNGALPFLDDRAVVEISCAVGAGRYKPDWSGTLPEAAVELIRKVKRYESAGVRAILDRSREGAIEALAYNPLVEGREEAAMLFDSFAKAAPRYFENWT